MANIRYKLRELFFQWLNRLEYERTHRADNYNYRPPSCMGGVQRRLNFGDDDELDGVIYFYEWSDAKRTPQSFFTLKAFENFLDRCGIYAPSYQWELIRHIHNPYVACRKDGKELIIKCNYESLKHALENEERPSNPFRSTGSPYYNPMAKGSEDREPYNVQITRPPENNAPKVLSCKIYPPVSGIQRPPMHMEVDNRYPDMEEVGSWFG